jgi:hypothetical protein
MAEVDPELVIPTFITLGPPGTCHEQVLNKYLAFQGLTDANVELVGDFVEGVDRVEQEKHSFLLQCSAHTEVHTVTERYPGKVNVVDTFIYPNIPLALLIRNDAVDPKNLAVVKAASAYPDLSQWDNIIEEPANPIIARKLLEGEHQAGVTFATLAEAHSDILHVAESYGEVDTTWIVYGQRKRFAGELIGHRIPWLFTGEEDPGESATA